MYYEGAADSPLGAIEGTQALVFGRTVLYGRYAPRVPVMFSTWGYNRRIGLDSKPNSQAR